MSFAHPLHLLVALVVAIGVALVLHVAARARNRAALTYSNLAFLRSSLRPNPWASRALAAIFLLGMLALAISFGGPTMALPMPIKDGQVFLCVDTSGSMSATDVAPTRSQAAQAAAWTFVHAVPTGTRVGLIAFSSSAAIVAPLTSDRAQLDAAVRALPPPNGGTAIGDALALAASNMRPGTHRVVILITDGVNNQGIDPMAAAQQLAQQHIVLYTIGIGTQSGGLIPGTDQLATIDEGALQAYAQATGGTYARAGSAQALHDALARLGRVTGFERRPVDTSFGLAAGGAIAILLAAALGFALGRLP